MRTFFLFIILLLVTGLAGAQIPQIEREALIAVYNSTDGDNWRDNTNWLGAVGTECTWYGVTCDGGRVSRVFLSNNRLTGSIPSEIGNLSNLAQLYLGTNQLTGSIPPEIGNLSNLRGLFMSSNDLTDSIPPEVGNLSNLESLSLYDNQLTSIPPEIGNLSNLESLYLYNNQLTGSIPPEIGNLSNLEDLYLYRNQLTGSIPPEIGNLSNLWYLHLYNNQLTGSIPPEIGNLSNLEDLYLYRNQLTGSLPPEIGNLSNLGYLHLDDNQLTGSIPPEIGNLSNLWSLDLYNNQLIGSIPPEIGDLSNLKYLRLENNQLTGSLPPEIGNLSRLEWLYLYNNQLTGSLPPEIGNLSNLSNLYLHENQLTGSIPPEIGNLFSLRFLYLYGNQLTGSLPPEIGNLSNLGYLHLDDNQLTGSIPPEIGNLSTLLRLYLNSNRLSGKVPAAITNLQYLISSNNIGYNALWTDDPAVEAFLDSKDPDWDDTQTVAPDGVTVASVGDRTVWLEWTPIPYEGHIGGYGLFSDELPGGTEAFEGATQDKLVTTFPVTGLQPSATYDLTIATTTYPHANNRNTVTSDPSVPVMVTTGDSGCPAPVVVFDHQQTPFTLEVQSTHDAFEWVTGEMTQSITVSPGADRWYWVKTFGPGSCAEAGVVFVGVRLFEDGFESGDAWAWSEVVPPVGIPPIETGLVSYWAFDDGAGSAAVADGTGVNDGVLVDMDPSLDWVAGKFDDGLHFDGVDSHVDFGNHTSLDVVDAMTLSVWLKPSDLEGIQPAVSKDLVAADSAFQLIASHDSNPFHGDAPRALLKADDAGVPLALTADAATPLALGVWHHLAMTYDTADGALRFYIDGVQAAVTTDASGHPIRISTAHLVAGAKSDLTRFYEGDLDDAALWSRALAPAEIARIWNGGVGRSISELLGE